MLELDDRTRLILFSVFILRDRVVMKGTPSMQHNIRRRKNHRVRKLIIALALFVLCVAVAYPIISYIKQKNSTRVDVDDIYTQWDEKNYQSVYDLTNEILKTQPYNNMALTFHGYASFYLAVAQVDTLQSQVFLDESITSLRVALLNAREDVLPQLYHMLGKAYFYKNTLSSYHYYSDLAIKYLTLASQGGYKADDIPEYLGLSYAALNMTEESIAAFTEALIVRESDALLLSIAEQYYKNDQLSAAKAYLHRVATDTTDDFIRIKCLILLGQIYLEEENYNEAEKEYAAVLEIAPNNADAYYGMGVLYEHKGELVKARAEWRKALQIDVNHQGALQKMAEYK